VKVALVTGVAGGIGAAAARRFVAEGWTVVGVDIKPGPAISGVVRETLDVANEPEVSALMKRIGAAHGRLDALVNNAAVQIAKPIIETTVEEWDVTMDVNIKGPFLTVKHGYHLLAACSGSIVNVSSVHAVATSRDIAAYAATKGAVLAFTRALAVELAGSAIRVNAVSPGAVDTAMLRDGLSRGHAGGGTVDDRLASLAARTVLGRIGTPDEIASAIFFLADASQSAFVTGQAFVIDGGATARLSTE
jgi:NAD(P)-dependent dehydrogenase (short-subunit alcohol dehydrogenase family)